VPRPSELTLSQQIKELMNYIWDNYVQLYELDDLFLMGVGNAYLGVKLLLTERREYHFIVVLSSSWTNIGHGRLQRPHFRSRQLCDWQLATRQIRHG
jgi:hypothetical protein